MHKYLRAFIPIVRSLLLVGGGLEYIFSTTRAQNGNVRVGATPDISETVAVHFK